MYKWSVRYTDYHKLESNLTYVIDNDDKSITFKFTYNKESKYNKLLFSFNYIW